MCDKREKLKNDPKVLTVSYLNNESRPTLGFWNKRAVSYKLDGVEYRTPPRYNGTAISRGGVARSTSTWNPRSKELVSKGVYGYRAFDIIDGKWKLVSVSELLAFTWVNPPAIPGTKLTVTKTTGKITADEVYFKVPHKPSKKATRVKKPKSPVTATVAPPTPLDRPCAMVSLSRRSVKLYATTREAYVELGYGNISRLKHVLPRLYKHDGEAYVLFDNTHMSHTDMVTAASSMYYSYAIVPIGVTDLTHAEYYKTVNAIIANHRVDGTTNWTVKNIGDKLEEMGLWLVDLRTKTNNSRYTIQNVVNGEYYSNIGIAEASKHLGCTYSVIYKRTDRSHPMFNKRYGHWILTKL